jgi:transposase, IS5 family
VTRLLDAPEFLAPFGVHYDLVAGRPSIRIDTYLRMMFLKFRWRLGYETLCREVGDSISWCRSCRIPVGRQGAACDQLVKLTHRVGSAVVDQFHQGAGHGRHP